MFLLRRHVLHEPHFQTIPRLYHKFSNFSRSGKRHVKIHTFQGLNKHPIGCLPVPTPTLSFYLMLCLYCMFVLNVLLCYTCICVSFMLLQFSLSWRHFFFLLETNKKPNLTNALDSQSNVVVRLRVRVHGWTTQDDFGQISAVSWRGVRFRDVRVMDDILPSCVYTLVNLPPGTPTACYAVDWELGPPEPPTRYIPQRCNNTNLITLVSILPLGDGIYSEFYHFLFLFHNQKIKDYLII